MENEKFKKFEWVKMTPEMLKIYPYNTGLIGMVLGYGFNPRGQCSPDTPLVMVKWVDRDGTGYVREKILMAL
jgi:hypothetical protein